MKRKSSNETWDITAIVMGFFILFMILTFGLRLVMISGSYGQVFVEIPVVSSPIKDPAFHTFEESAAEIVRSTTPAVVLTSDAFYFGDLDAFSTELMDSRNKFKISHQDGLPQVSTLLTDMDEWLRKRARSENIPLSKSIVFIPEGAIPLPIVIQIIASLKQSPLFQHVILSNGLI